jgi:hypothetical protein
MIYGALFGWSLVIAALAARLKWPILVAVGLIGGYLLLPPGQGLDLPLLPALTKNSLPAFTLVLLALLLRPGMPGSPLAKAIPAAYVQPGWLPRSWVGSGLLALWILGIFGTVATNRDVFVAGGQFFPALSLRDAATTIFHSLGAFLTLLLARKYFAHPQMHRLLLVAFTVAALLYSLPTLYEVRMSPNLNRMVYGYFPHDWTQHVRGDGFRPLVFLGHALWLSLFIALGTLACLALVRLARSSGERVLYACGGVWLFGTLILTKSLGAMLFTSVLAIVVLLFSKRLQVLTAGLIAIAVLLYPMLRSVDIAPTDQVVALAERIDPARASSFAFRVANEDLLLAKASQRPIFGWGGWGRSRVFNEDGRDVTVTDGAWIIAFGHGGWVEYIARFGLLTIPIILLAFRSRKYTLTPETALLALVLSANMIDMIPNATQTTLTWLMAGALLGRLEVSRAPATPEVPEDGDALKAAPPETGTPAYTRQIGRHSRKRPRAKSGRPLPG